MSNSDENKKLFISHENINAVKNDEFNLKDIPSLNKSNFELKIITNLQKISLI